MKQIKEFLEAMCENRYRFYQLTDAGVISWKWSVFQGQEVPAIPADISDELIRPLIASGKLKSMPGRPNWYIGTGRA